MLRVGLTGGIASGKSTVAAMLRELGCHVLDADKIAHRLIEPGGPAYQDVVREFGTGILTSEGRVDRVRLGAMVFADPVRLKRLNAIVHPFVLQAIDHELASIERAAPETVAVVEAALLIEAGYHHKLDRLVVTWCTPEQQLDRLTRKDSGRELTPDQARQRITAQMTTEEKRRLASDEIDCSGPLEQTREQVRALVAAWKREAETRGRNHRGADRNDRKQ